MYIIIIMCVYLCTYVCVRARVYVWVRNIIHCYIVENYLNMYTYDNTNVFDKVLEGVLFGPLV